MNNLILIGFDRSGTSAISRTLSMHPKIELIFRPFNSGPIRRKMYRIMNDSIASNEDIAFFSKLERGVLDSSYFVSQWHNKFSTVKDSFIEDRLHVIITNINHFSVRWVNNSFPGIEQWAIWRDPEQILNSCIRNEFYGEWYSDSLFEVIESVRCDLNLLTLFGKWIDLVQTANYTIKTAFLIAVRNYFLFNEIEPNKIVDYEVFKSDPNKALEPLLKYFNVEMPFDFSHYLSFDLNSIPSKDGYSAHKVSNDVITESDAEIAREMFVPLHRVYDLKRKG